MGRILFGTLIGFIFPSCGGIVPVSIVFREEKVPSHTAVPLWQPVINPIVLFATYSAFGNSIQMNSCTNVSVVTVLRFSRFLNFYSCGANTEVHIHDFSNYLPVSLLLPVSQWQFLVAYLVFGCCCQCGSGLCASFHVLTSGLDFTPSHSPIYSSSSPCVVGAETSFSRPVLAFLVIGPILLDVKNTLDDEELSDQSLCVVQFISILALSWFMLVGGPMIRFLICLGISEITMCSWLSE